VRTVFQTPPQPATRRMPNGEIADGTAYFEALLYEPGEQTIPSGPRGEPSGLLVSAWRAGLQAGALLSVPIDDGVVTPIAPAVIPANVLEQLPATSRLQLLWRWTRKG
jgi:hypothetical protein